MEILKNLGEHVRAVTSMYGVVSGTIVAVKQQTELVEYLVSLDTPAVLEHTVRELIIINAKELL